LKNQCCLSAFSSAVKMQKILSQMSNRRRSLKTLEQMRETKESEKEFWSKKKFLYFGVFSHKVDSQ
jgi:hypothetical protein